MSASIAGSEVDDDGDFAESHEINVTPFIDVMLVLLIIFMVAAPLSTVDLPIDLPTSSAMPQKKPDKPTYVSIKPDLDARDRRRTRSSAPTWSRRSMPRPMPTRISSFSCAPTAPLPMAISWT